MIEEQASAGANPSKKTASESDGARQRSTIGFPYNDLTSAISMAQAVHQHVGHGDCDDHQLAAWTDQSSKSSGFRTQISAARMFGLIETAGGGRYRLSSLGRMIVDPVKAREARARAFLNVPLYSEVYEKYRGTVIPPAEALERDMESMGVATKMKDRARRVFERSAEQAGFFEHGRNRLVKPGVAAGENQANHGQQETPAGENRLHGSGDGGDGGGDSPEVDPIIEGLLARLPQPGEVWPETERELWLELLRGSFKLIYKEKPEGPKQNPSLNIDRQIADILGE